MAIAGQKSVDHLARRGENLLLVHVPVHASWLNQVEVCFSIIQRKALSPNDFENLAEVASRVHAFERRYEEVGTPFEWKFTGTSDMKGHQGLEPSVFTR